MDILSAVGLAWIILTSVLATVAILYLAYIGFRVLVREGNLDIRIDSKPNVSIKTIPVSWGKTESRRVVNIGL